MSTMMRDVLAAREQAEPLESLQDLYLFRQEADVQAFLANHPHLSQFLLDAYTQLRTYFGPKLRVALQVEIEPEPPLHAELLAYIITPLNADEARARLDALQDNWFLDQLPCVAGQFNFGLEFV